VHRRSWLAGTVAGLLAGATACSGGSPQSGDPSGPGGGAGCSDPTTVRVSAAADIKDVVAARATAIEGAQCARYQVKAEAAAAVAARGMAKGAEPDLWIADSPVWPSQVLRQKPGSVSVYPEAIASTPVVLAVPAAIVAQGKVPTGQQPMAKQMAGSLPALKIANPSESSTTLMLLLTAWHNSGQDRMAQLAAAKAFVPLARSTDTDDQLYERAVPGNAQGPVVFPATEQRMAAFNAQHSDATLTSLGAVEGLAALKYVAVRPADMDPKVQKAVDALAAEMRTPQSQDALRAAGFRVDNRGTANVPGLPQDVKISLDSPLPETVQTVTGLMTQLSRPVNMLMVVDTSGSMLDPSGYGGSRIELTAKAVQTALNFVPPNTKGSLWQMASNTEFGAKDYRVVVPMTPLSGPDGSLLPAALQFANAFDQIIPTVKGGTGLYDTISDAYAQAVAAANPESNQVIVVLTDGRNEYDPQTITLDQLVARIKAQRPGPDKPVTVALAGLGPQSDMAALTAIAAAAGGTASVVNTETNLSDVILASILPTG